MRAHHFLEPDSETETHITGNEYTYCVMGAHGGGPTVMRALGKVFGGMFRNDIGETEELFEHPGSPAP